jgi:hypothetical protein
MTKRRSTWLGLVSAVFYAAVLVVSSVRPQSVATSSCTEFAGHPGCPEVEGGGNRLARFARRLINRIQNTDTVIENGMPETAEIRHVKRIQQIRNERPHGIGVAIGNYCYVGSRQLLPIEGSNSIQSLRKEQANGYSHKDSHLITAYAPAFCPV